MTLQEGIEELKARRLRALGGGGPDKIERQHAGGKLTVRERIDGLIDPGSFLEMGQLAGSYATESDDSFVPDGYVGGLARIEGRDVVLGGEDFTVRGGSEGSNKQKELIRLAHEYRLPLVLLHDGAGFNIASLLDNRKVMLPWSGSDGVRKILDLMASVPMVGAIMGSVAGGPAGYSMLSHFTLMVKETSQLFVAGPPVVFRSIGTEITKQELGGSHIHTRMSGAVDNEAENEPDALGMIRKFLSYLPTNVWQLPPYRPTNDPSDRREEGLLTVLPENRRRPYDMRKLVRMVVDDGEFFEITPYFGASLITGFARLGGHAVAVLGNNPKVGAGAVHADSADKQVHFMELADQFHLPIVYFTDVPGLAIGPDAEKHAVVRKGMRALWMTAQLTVPLINVTVGRCYGFGGGVTRNDGAASPVFAWPSSEFGGIPVEGGIDAAFRRIIETADDPEAKRLEIQSRLMRLKSPFPVAENGAIADIIDPRDTRPTLIRTLDAMQSGRERNLGLRAKYGVRP